MIFTMALVSPLQGSRSFAAARVVYSGANLRRPQRVSVGIAAASSSLPSDEEQHRHSSSQSEPPRLENFSQSRLSRSMKERTILQKAESALYEKCMALEGEKAYECWEALFDYEQIKDEYTTECVIAQAENRAEGCQPLERFENMVRQSGGAASLIDNVRMVAKVAKKKAAAAEGKAKTDHSIARTDDRTPQQVQTEKKERHEDGGIPRTPEEQHDESDGVLPESPYTRVLRRRGRSPAWFTKPPEHETD